MGFAKLHTRLINSSLWTEDMPTRIMFITLLALADATGCVFGAQFGLGRVANLDPDDAAEAFSNLLSPDPYSTDLDRDRQNEGRRIVKIPGGFRIVNYEYYRHLQDDDDRRRQYRESKRKTREAEKITHLSTLSTLSTKVHEGLDTSTQAEAEAEAETENPKPKAQAPMVQVVPFNFKLGTKDRDGFDLPDWINPATWHDYLGGRKKKLKESGKIRVVKELQKLHASDNPNRLPLPEFAEAVLNQSIVNGWQGVFPLKAQTTTARAGAIDRRQQASDEWLERQKAKNRAEPAKSPP